MFNSSTSARPKTRWRPSVSFWIVAAIVLLLILIFGTAGGFGFVLLILALTAIITGLYSLFFKRRSWVGIPHRKSALFVAGSGIVAFLVAGVVIGASADSKETSTKSALVASSAQPSAATAAPTSPANSACLTARETQKFGDELLVCTMGSNQRLVWMTEDESKKAVALKAAADKAAADKAAADKLAADKAAADKLAADKAVADKLAADKVAADQAAAAAAAAAQEAANQAAQQAQAPAAPAAPSTVSGYVTAGAFCSGNGGVGVSKTGKAMVCAPASDGRLRWRSA